MHKLLLMLVLIPLIYACSSNDEFDMENNEEAENLEPYYMNLEYQGKTYHVLCQIDTNDSLVFLDSDFKRLYEDEISQIPNLVTVIKNDTALAYYTSMLEMEKGQQIMLLDSTVLNQNYLSTRVLASKIAGRVSWWDDKDYKDRSDSVEISYLQLISIPSMKKRNNFNDKVSSLIVKSFIPKGEQIALAAGVGLTKKSFSELTSNPWTILGDDDYVNTSEIRLVFLGYEDSNYEGDILCIIPENGSTVKHRRLKSIGWNDKISSLALRIAYKGLYTANDNEE